GKSVHWQANRASPSRDMPVESFFRLALEPYLRLVPGTGISTLRRATRSLSSIGADSGGIWIQARFTLRRHSPLSNRELPFHDSLGRWCRKSYQSVTG